MAAYARIASILSRAGVRHSGGFVGTPHSRTEVNLAGDVLNNYVKGKAEEAAFEGQAMEMWKKLSIVGLPVVIGWSFYAFSGHHDHVEKPQAEYLRIRSKAFPWGDCDLFDRACWNGKSGHGHH
eukprot:tig00020553_g10626.t1